MCALAMLAAIACGDGGGERSASSTAPPGTLSPLSTAPTAEPAVVGGQPTSIELNTLTQQKFATVSAGFFHTCGLKTDGTIACWGSHGSGEYAPPSGTFTSVSAGSSYTCGVRSDGGVVCWGPLISKVGGATPHAGQFTAVSAGQDHVCAVGVDGAISCWGSKYYGQAAPPEGRFAAVSAGGQHSCGITIEGTVVCWGSNFSGQAEPSPICTAIAMGDLHTVRQFIGNNPDINASDCGGDPLLHTAIEKVETDIVRMLVDAGADVNAKDKWGISPANLANAKLAFFGGESEVTKEESEILQILLNAGAVADFAPPALRIRVIDRSDSSLTIAVYESVGVETYYAVRRRNATESGEWVDLEVRDTDGRFEDRGLNADSTYYYALRACNAVGCSELSSEAGGVTESSGQVDAPAAPSLSAETRRVRFVFNWDTYIDLTWDAVGGATYYEVYRRDSLVSPLSAPRTTWTSSDHLASYRVKACNKAGCSPFSNTK